MANTFTQTYHHVVFSTKNREPCLAKERRDDVYRYIWGILKAIHCTLHRIGGVDDHVHMLVSLHPTVALATMVEKVKSGSSGWIRREAVFTVWPGWQDGYGAFTVSAEHRDAVVEYIKDQEAHHATQSFRDEFRSMLDRAGAVYDERWLP